MCRKIYFLIESAIKIFSNLSRIRFLQNLKFNLGNANNVGSIKLKQVLAATCVATASRRGYAKHRLAKFKGIFLSVATVATAGKLSKENFLLHLKECVLLYFTAFVVFKDVATSIAK